MLNDLEKQGFKEILRELKYDDLVALSDTVTKRQVKVAGQNEAISAVLNFTENAVELLKRKKLRRDLLFQYLSKHNVGVSVSADKSTLVRNVLRFWGSKDEVPDFMDLELNLAEDTDAKPDPNGYVYTNHGTQTHYTQPGSPYNHLQHSASYTGPGPSNYDPQGQYYTQQGGAAGPPYSQVNNYGHQAQHSAGYGRDPNLTQQGHSYGGPQGQHGQPNYHNYPQNPATQSQSYPPQDVNSTPQGQYPVPNMNQNAPGQFPPQNVNQSPQTQYQGNYSSQSGYGAGPSQPTSPYTDPLHAQNTVSQFDPSPGMYPGTSGVQDDMFTVAQQQPSHELQALGEKFAGWFFQVLNSNNPTNSDTPQDFGPQHFWDDSNFTVLTVSPNANEDVFSGTMSVSQKFLSFVKEDFLLFCPNISSEGVYVKSSPHGLVLIMVCGTVHRNNDCLGIFQQVFGIIRDPRYDNNWKIKVAKLQLKSSQVTSMPKLSGNIEGQLDALVPV